MAEPRNAEHAAAINPQADAFAKAKLRMLDEERAFEDWWTSQPGGSGVGAYSDLAKAAQATHRSFARLGWMARVREVDRLREAVKRYGGHDQLCEAYFHNDRVCDCGWVEAQS